jgi:glycosyltransferase involved in cell wall biosynthesis
VNLTVAIPSRSDRPDPWLLKTVLGIDATCASRPEVVVLRDASAPDPALPRWVRQVVSPEPVGTSRARHLAILAASNDAIVTCDAHMVFPQGWAQDIADELAGRSQALLCCRMGHLDAGRNETLGPQTPTSSGARIVTAVSNGGGETFAIAARWHPHAVGPIPAIMGACYAISRRWYIDGLGSPWAAGMGWGCDEETISIANWLCGGETRLLPTVVGHVFGTGQHMPWTTDDLARVWFNRVRIVDELPMHPATRERLRRGVLDCPAVAQYLPIVERLIRQRAPANTARRKFLEATKKTFEDFLAAHPEPQKPQ